jgi:hypothetical protein
MHRRTVSVLCAAQFALMWCANGASGQTPVALVLEKSGTTVPALTPYSEILAGTTIGLPGGARLVFLHYQTCTTVTVVGGEIVVEQASYKAANGSTPATVRTACPAKVRLERPGSAAGLTMRSLQPPSGLSTRPSFILVGSNAETLGRLRVVRGEATVLEGSLSGREFRWPVDAAPLDPRADYELILLPQTSDGRQAKMTFRPTESSSAVPGSSLTLIRVEQ